MSSIIGTQFKRVSPRLREIDQRRRGVRIREVHRGWTGIEFPQNRHRTAWIDNRAAQRRA